MAPASSWCPDIVVIITTTITIITASIAATIEIAGRRMMRKQDPKGPVFLLSRAFSSWVKMHPAFPDSFDHLKMIRFFVMAGLVPAIHVFLA
jgi:hypothetical protein